MNSFTMQDNHNSAKDKHSYYLVLKKAARKITGVKISKGPWENFKFGKNCIHTVSKNNRQAVK